MPLIDYIIMLAEFCLENILQKELEEFINKFETEFIVS
jgi:hypothetical protein